MRKSVAAKLLANAALKDYNNNPEAFREAGSQGQLKKLIAADVSSALRDVPVPGLFPNLRAAATQIAASGLSGMGEDEPVGTNDTWAKEQGYTAPAAAPAGDDWTKAITDIFKSAATAGATIYSAKLAADSKTQQASLLQRALNTVGIKTGTTSPGVQTSSMMGGGMLPMLLLGGAVLAGGAFVVSTMNKGGGKSRRRRRR